MRAVALAALVLIAAAPVRPDRYRTCVAQVKTSPREALGFATQWRQSTGAVGAMHCQALALLALDDVARAGGVLDAAAEKLLASGTGPAAAADLLAQAGNAWLLSGDPARARMRLTSALALMPAGNPGRADALIDRARALAGLEDKGGALADLDAAHTLAPARADILLLRAEVHAARGDTALARADLATAKTLPADADIRALMEKLTARIGS